MAFMIDAPFQVEIHFMSVKSQCLRPNVCSPGGEKDIVYYPAGMNVTASF